MTIDVSDPPKRDQVDRISHMMKQHYQTSFRRHGPSSEGVDWGTDASKANLRYKNMLAALGNEHSQSTPSLLDVGCGYGGLYAYSQLAGINLDYTGIDIASNMIQWGKTNLKTATFIEGDFLNYDLSYLSFDYVVCNGILTQKLEASMLDMDDYAKMLINKMYGLCVKGVAFNMMTTSVNYFAPNLYYKHPCEILCYCLSSVTNRIKLDHSYGLYEFTVYLFK